MTRSAAGSGRAPRRSSAVPADLRPGTARIAVDLLGGDDAPAVVVDGALYACGADPDLSLLLVGPTTVADEILAVLPSADRGRVEVRPAPHGIGMTDPPARARRPDGTVRAAVAAVAEGRADAVVSAGPSGATITAAVLGLGRFDGVRQPALAAMLPSTAGPVVLLDVGASVEASPAVLAGHAVLGAAYARIRLDHSAPRVGLLSIGAETGRGDRVRRATEAVLSAHPLPAGGRYVGLVEGHDVSLGDRADVFVVDGFTGNVLLKGVEGAYRRIGARLLTDSPPRGAALLGVPGTVVVCHGAASGADVASGIALAADLHRTGVVASLSALTADPTEMMP